MQTSYAVLLLVTLYIFKRWANARSTGPKPPGPSAWPVIGNLLDMPKEKEWETFGEWARKWGDIVSVSVAGRTIIILNSAQEAVEMLEGRGSIYSDRPTIPIADLVGWSNSPSIAPSKSEIWKQGRKFFHQLFGTNVSVARFIPVEEQETQKLLVRLLADSENLSENIRMTTVAVIMRIAYGYHVESIDDPFIKSAELVLEQFSYAISPGRLLVNLIPALKYLPEWAPGGSFKRQARIWTATLDDAVERPHSFAKKQMALGIAEDSCTSRLLEDNGGETIDPGIEFNIKWIGVTTYMAATDTTMVSIHAFFMAMILYPECQKRAQAELDAVVGNSRLPQNADRDSLPYLHALTLEVMRWHSVSPLGFMHTVSEDDTYKGHFIPRGSMIMANIWAMTHDPAIYRDPMTFNPDRFLASPGHTPEPDPRQVVFGFGRRICPGRLLADISVFLSCAMSLSVFDISPHIENGVPVLPIQDQLPGIVSHPPPFKCTIKPRSEAAIALIQSTSS
ncbi:cytochrome P450 [Pluteus cervinus]|uniref:Cytochrome P450 n=1 Tax=Pluteus cervinus TaxID=181527 RepID=A0ACD3BC00_9AGAR|nr:cytochrome P450 [Pluteus cervinus]